MLMSDGLRLKSAKWPAQRLIAIATGIAISFSALTPSPSYAAVAGSGDCASSYTSGGTGSESVRVAEEAGYCYISFHNQGQTDTISTYTWTVPSSVTDASVLVVGGGGGGGSRHAGGGGAGEYVQVDSLALTPGANISIQTGGGGSGADPGTSYLGTQGQTSYFKIGSNGLTALGGGAGQWGPGGNGGSGAGGSGTASGGSAVTSSQTTFSGATLSSISWANAGSEGASEASSTEDFWAGGGGGGAGSAGSRPTQDGVQQSSLTSAATAVGGAGGAGKTPSWLPSSINSALLVGETSGGSIYFAAGGGGGMGADGNAGGPGGLGGGGDGVKYAIPTSVNSGLTSSGSGGGGAGFDDVNPSTLDGGIVGNAPAGNGGSGIVIVRYATPTLDTGATSEIDYYLDLNGTNQAAYGLGGSSKLNLGSSAWTIEAWIKPAAAEAGLERMIINKELSYELAIYNGTFQYALMPSDTNQTWFYRDTGIKPRLDAWQHVALTKTGNSIEFYFDGQLAYSITDATFAPSTLRSSNLILTVGGRESTTSGSVPTGAFFDGGIDEVRIWSERRTDTQILQSMHAKLDGTQANLLAYWDFNEPTGDLVFNRADGVADLSLYNAPARTDVKETSSVGSDTVLTFPRTYLPGTGSWTTPVGVGQLQALVVGGGGGGGGTGGRGFSGGGGAGGVSQIQTITQIETDYAIVVGQGGAGGSPTARTNPQDFPQSGQQSSFGTLSASGGGGGGHAVVADYSSSDDSAPGPGGGGGAQSGFQAGSALGGFTGGAGFSSSNTDLQAAGGGAGSNGNGYSAVSGAAGAGGPGISSSISGNSTSYGGGGGGGKRSNASGSAGLGGSGGGGAGGFSAAGVNGTTNLGGGGGGAGGTGQAGGNGGSGVVILRFVTPTQPGTVSNFSANQRLIDADSNSDSVTLTWTAVSHSTPVTGYTIEWGIDSNYSNTPINVSGGSTTSQVVSGLNDGADYYFRIKAVNAVGPSATWATTASVPVSNEDYALDFDSSFSATTSASPIPIADGAEFSVEAWIKPDSVIGYKTILAQGNVPDSQGKRFYLGLWNSGSDYVVHIARSATAANVSIPNPVGRWVHIAATVASNDQINLYVDGHLKATVTLGNAGTNVGFGIGSDEAGNGPFEGQIDQVKIWDGVLDQLEVVASMHSWGKPTSGVDNSLRAHYDFNDFTNGSTVSDQFGSFDLDLVGATSSDLAPLVIRDTASSPGRVIYDFTRSYLTQTGGWTVPDEPGSPTTLLVAGGGSGGSRHGGGGGAGELVYKTADNLSGVVPVIIGQGGHTPGSGDVPGNPGQDSTLGASVANGGGAGGRESTSVDIVGGVDLKDGGSGGGQAHDYNTSVANNLGASVLTAGGFGNNGGIGAISSNYRGGGGGGAGSPGGDGSTLALGSGGSGLAYSISGTATCYAAGGGGGASDGLTASPGGGCAGLSSTGGVSGVSTGPAGSGAPGTGSGGGGSGLGSGASFSINGLPGSGGSGRVVVSYLIPNQNLVLNYNSTDTNSFDNSPIVNDLSSSDISGLFNKSIALDPAEHGWIIDGAATFMDVADISSNLFATDGITVDFEADFGSANNWERILDFGLGQASQNIWVGRAGLTNNLWLELYGAGSSVQVCSATNAITPGLNRYTIALGPNSCKVFVAGNDAPVADSPGTKTLPAPGQTLTSNYIGRSNWSADSYFAGQIRSIRVYRGAFSPSEIGSIGYRIVTLDASPGTVTDSSLITSGSVRLPNPTNPAAPFDGWALTGTNTAVANPYTPLGDVTLEALYSANPPTVSYGDATFSPSGTNAPTVVSNGHTGAKTFSSTTSSVCSVDSSTGVATILTAGTCSISTVFAASGSYGEATVLASFEIAKANQSSLTWDQAAISYSYLGTLTLTGLVTGGSGTGAISFTPSGTCTVTGNVLSGGSAGSSCSVTVTKGGDVSYNPISLTQSITINKINQAALGIANPGTVKFGDVVQLSATGGSGNGAVMFSSTSTSICSETSTEGEFEFVGVGDCVVTVSKAADDNYNIQSGSRTITSVKATHTLSFTSTVPANPIVNGTYTVSGVSSTGEVSLAPSFAIAAGSSSICSIAGNMVTFNLDGTCEIEASKSATANYEAAQTITQRIVVGQANQTITFGAIANKTFGDPAFTVSATASSGNTVTFTTGSGTTNSACSVTSAGLVVIAAVGACEIVANSASGNGYAAASAVSRTFHVAAAPAGAPFITAVSFGDSQLTATYFAPSNLGGGTVSGYQLRAFDGSTLVATATNCAVSGTLSCTVTGLTNGTSYTLKIAAITEAGLGAFSPASAAVSPAANPEAVTSLTAVQGNAKLTVTWRAPSNLGGGTLDSFRIFHREAGQSYPGSYINLTAAQAAAATTAGVTSIEITGLTNGQAYDVKVITVTTANTAQLTSNTAEVTQSPYTVPDAPLSVTVLEVGDDIVITWSQPVFDGGSAVSGYSVLLDSVAATCAATSASSCTIQKSTLTPGTTVTIDVKAENDAGFSSPVSTTFQVASVGGGVSFTPSTPLEGPATGIEIVSGQSWAWTKRIAKNQVKVYIKFPEMGANYQINLQKNDGNFVRKMSKTINTTADSDLRVVGKWYYLVRTITLPGEGRYRIEITQDGQRVMLNGEDRPAVYNYR